MASNKRKEKKSDSASSTGPLQTVSETVSPWAVWGDPTELTFQVSVLEVMSFNNRLFPLGKTNKDSSS